MLYCTYDQYQANGGTLDEAAFTPLCIRASKLIDRYTFGRAESHAKICESCKEDLTHAAVRIIDVLNTAASTCAVPGAVSVSNDGYSVTFSSGALAERTATEAQGVIDEALGSDPHGLLYRGCY